MFSLDALRRPFGLGAFTVILGFSIATLSSKVNDSGFIHHWWPVFLGNFIAISQLIYWHAIKETTRVIRTVAGHAVRVLIRAVIIAGIALLWTRGYSNPEKVAFFIFLWSIFALEFDIFYALEKGKHWLYMGTVSQQDKWFRNTPEVMLGLDFLLFVFSLYYFSNPELLEPVNDWLIKTFG